MKKHYINNVKDNERKCDGARCESEEKRKS